MDMEQQESGDFIVSRMLPPSIADYTFTVIKNKQNNLFDSPKMRQLKKHLSVPYTNRLSMVVNCTEYDGEFDEIIEKCCKPRSIAFNYGGISSDD